MAWVTWTIVVGLVVAREVYRWRRDREMDRMLQLLHWRGRFAQNRRDLIHLMHCREVDVNSDTVQSMYLFCSAVVRRAKRYPEFSREIMDVALANAPKTEMSNKIRRDLKAMSPQARELFQAYAQNIHGLLWDYSMIYRILEFLKKALPKTEPPRPVSTRHRVLGSRRLSTGMLVFNRARRLRELTC